MHCVQEHNLCFAMKLHLFEFRQNLLQVDEVCVKTAACKEYSKHLLEIKTALFPVFF